MKVPLLDYLQWKMGCAYLSDLHWLSGGQKMRLARSSNGSKRRRRPCMSGTTRWNTWRGVARNPRRRPRGPR